jgi:hypothetical protein
VRHAWSVLCDRVSQALDDGRLSLVDVTQEIRVEAPAADDDGGSVGARIDLYLVSFWLRSNPSTPERGQVRLSVQSPDSPGDATEASTRELDLVADCSAYTVFRIDVLPFVAPGRFEFRLHYRADAASDWQLMGEVPLDLDQEDAPIDDLGAEVS